MIFTIIEKNNGDTKIINANDLDFYCNCPKCNKRVHVPLYEWLVDDADFDLDSSVFCDSCSDELNKIRTDIKSNISVVDAIPPDKLEVIHDIFREYKKFSE